MRRILTVGLCVVVVAATATTAITQSAAATGPLLPSAASAPVYFLVHTVQAKPGRESRRRTRNTTAGTGFGPQVYAFYKKFKTGLNRSVAADSIGSKYASRRQRAHSCGGAHARTSPGRVLPGRAQHGRERRVRPSR